MELCYSQIVWGNLLIYGDYGRFSECTRSKTKTLHEEVSNEVLPSVWFNNRTDR